MSPATAAEPIEMPFGIWTREMQTPITRRTFVVLLGHAQTSLWLIF